MKPNQLKRIVLFLVAIGTSIVALFFIITSTWIGYDVKDQCQRAKQQYTGDCVESLSALLNDSHQSFRQRNQAIWALGQLGDNRALPILQSFYTGIIPNREPLDKMMSQYELKKAINLTSGGLNITAPIWRWNF